MLCRIFVSMKTMLNKITKLRRNIILLMPLACDDTSVEIQDNTKQWF